MPIGKQWEKMNSKQYYFILLSMWSSDELKEWDKIRESFIQYSNDIKTIVRKGLVSMDKEELKNHLNGWKTETLEIVIKALDSIENEDYEICQVVKEILEERGKTKMSINILFNPCL